MDNFVKLGVMGKGRFGTIYLYEQKSNKQKVIVKEICTSDQEDFLVAANEVQILSSLCHPNIIQYYESFFPDGAICIVMEFATRGSLSNYINKQSGHLREKQILSLFSQILIGLNYIHSKQIIHRDLKSDNIMITGSDQLIVKIGDFGISKLLKGYHINIVSCYAFDFQSDKLKTNVIDKTQTLIGTTNYLAPEICDGQPYDKKSDIWALGCVLYEMCAKEKLFDGSVSEIVSSITNAKIKPIPVNHYTKSVHDLIQLIVVKDPKLRPNTAYIMKEAALIPFLCNLYINVGRIV